MREQKIVNRVVTLVVIVSLSAVLLVSWLRAPHGEKPASAKPPPAKAAPAGGPTGGTKM